jgi:inorganic pyrophosphatase
LTNLTAVSPGKNLPREINVIIEIAKGSSIKYEINPESGIIYVARKLSTSMIYPGNYGFVPQTKTDDGDPVDVLILGSGEPLIPSCVIGVRPIGVLLTEDQDGGDSKIIAVQQKMRNFLIFAILKTLRNLRASRSSTFSNTIKSWKRRNSSK